LRVHPLFRSDFGGSAVVVEGRCQVRKRKEVRYVVLVSVEMQRPEGNKVWIHPSVLAEFDDAKEASCFWACIRNFVRNSVWWKGGAR
jgi:hypothetical protein